MTESSPVLTRCATHADVSTALACGKCGKAICPRCLIQTPVGARCRQCAQLRRLPTYEVSLRHYLLAVAVGLPTGALLGAVWGLLPALGLLSLLLAAGVGYLLGEAISLAVNRKRGPGLQIIAGFSLALSFLISRVLPAWLLLANLNPGLAASPGVYLDLAMASVRSFLGDPWAWLAVGIGLFLAVSRLR